MVYSVFAWFGEGYDGVFPVRGDLLFLEYAVWMIGDLFVVIFK